jgi:hypothetical protein
VSKGWFETVIHKDGSISFEIWDKASEADITNLKNLMNLLVKQGKDEERERIIKLLEKNHLTAASELIEYDALIKGENK